MDEMRIQTNFVKGIISKAIGKAIRDSLGCDISIQLNDLYVNHDKGMTRGDLNLRVSLEDEQLSKLVEKLGLF